LGWAQARPEHFNLKLFSLKLSTKIGFCSMATMSISSNLHDSSSYGNRMVTVTITARNQQLMRLANQTLSVPYSRLSQAMRSIHRSGGKVLKVSMQAAGQPTPSGQSKSEDGTAAKKKKR
jgi:CpcD/allophycocyanin linker domain